MSLISFAEMPVGSVFSIDYNGRTHFKKIGNGYAHSLRPIYKPMTRVMDVGTGRTPIYDLTFIHNYLNSTALTLQETYGRYENNPGFLYNTATQILETQNIISTVPHGFVKAFGHERTCQAKVWVPSISELQLSDVNFWRVVSRDANPLSFKCYDSYERTARSYLRLEDCGHIIPFCKPAANAIFALNSKGEYIPVMMMSEVDNQRFAHLLDGIPGYQAPV